MLGKSCLAFDFLPEEVVLLLEDGVRAVLIMESNEPKASRLAGVFVNNQPALD